MTMFRYAFLFGTMMIASASLALAQYNLVVEYSGLDNYVGKHLFVRVTKVTLEIANVRGMVNAPSGSLSMFCLEDTSSYQVEIFVDGNDNDAYDGIETDPSWLMLVTNFPGKDQTVSISMTRPQKEINYPLPPIFSTLETTHRGRWTNLTFGTSGPATATFTRSAQTSTINGNITVTGGAFGQPGPITFAGTGEFDLAGRTGTLNMIAPYGGTITMDHGFLTGTITYPSVGVTMAIQGTYADNQIMYTYTMSGAFTANGYMVMGTESATNVAHHEIATQQQLHITPLPAQTHATITFNPASGAVTSVSAFDASGARVALPWTSNEQTVDVNLTSVLSGVVAIEVSQQRATNRIPLLIQR